MVDKFHYHDRSIEHRWDLKINSIPECLGPICSKHCPLQLKHIKGADESSIIFYKFYLH